MTKKTKLKSTALTSRGLVLALTLILLSTNSITAGGITASPKKKPASKTLRSMARVYMAYGEYAKAQPLAEKALSMAKNNYTSDSELAMCLIDLSTVYKNQNKLDDAEKMCQMGLELQKKYLYEKHPYLAYTLSILSSIRCQQGNYDQAWSDLNKAVAIMIDAHSPDDKALAPFLVDAAKLHVAQGNLQQADRYYQKAMPLINNSYGPKHLYTANILTGIAKLYTLQEKYPQAEDAIDQALIVQEKVYGPDNHLIADSWVIKAKTCQAKGDTAKAEKLINKALVAVEKTGNMLALVKLQQDVSEIRLGEMFVYAPVIQAFE